MPSKKYTKTFVCGFTFYNRIKISSIAELIEIEIHYKRLGCESLSYASEAACYGGAFLIYIF